MESGEIDLNELFGAQGVKLCPYDQTQGCAQVGTSRCNAECDTHPESWNLKKDVVEGFEKEPWRLYCLTCQQFIESRVGHCMAHVDELAGMNQPNHLVAAGIREYREKWPQYVQDLLMGREEETGDMSEFTHI